MNMVEILKLILSGAGGGVIGLVGSWLKAKEENKRFELETARIDKQQAHEVALASMKIEAADREAIARAFEASQAAAAPTEQTPAGALWLLSAVRPALTALLIGFAVYCYVSTPESVERTDLARDAFALCGMAVGWWFGSRPSLRSSAARPAAA